MLSFVIDLMVLMLLGFFVWSGYRKGLILSAATLIIFFISIIIGSSIASANYEKAAVVFDDLLDWVGDEATENALSALEIPASALSDFQVDTVARNAMIGLGVQEKAAKYLGEIVAKEYKAGSNTLYEVVSLTFIRALAWVVLFFAGFLMTNLLFSLIANFASALFQFPVLKQLDTVGGLAFGFITGLMILFIIGIGLRYAGIVIPDAFLNDTFFLRMFINANPFGGIVNIG